MDTASNGECERMRGSTGEVGVKGDKFAGRYSLGPRIGHGSTAQVFEAWDVDAGRRLAVKVLSVDRAGDGFRWESRKIAAFYHPNIVSVYEMGQAEFGDETVPYVAMEYLPGGDLMGLIEARKRLPEREAARLGAGVAKALAYAHARDVVHEDVKPQNILIEDARRARLTDFNVVRALRPGGFSGAPRYAAPECLRGEAVPASDIYSLGVTLYQMVVGVPPFRAGRKAVMRQHTEEKPTPPSGLSSISREMEGLILSCLNKTPSERPAAKDVEKDPRRILWRPILRSPLRSARLWLGKRLSP
jgi:serine/threonine-protein kinase